ncbi:unnamed protein product [Phaedon cochleariae]|uniref:Uncharacterized protein n=1 Tax=Phaedon cochleariae TaxID=80249 RepID=A0A9N9SK78_PHACE|nr:unnamed protein product [Phaedon cochleariae]
MKLDILYLIFVGYFIQVSEEGGNGKHVHIKIHVPHLIHKHNHKHTIYKKVPVHVGGHEKKHVVIHKHDHNHKHKHDHGHKHGHHHKHKHGHKHGHKHQGKHQHKHGHDHKHGHKHGHKHDHKHKHLIKKQHGYDHGHYGIEPQVNHYDSYAIDPVNFDDDGYKSSKKSVRSEHYEVEQKNPYAIWPEEQHVVKGSYKVQETDPYDLTTTSYQAYDSPVSKKIAQALTNFDSFGRTNLPKGEDENGYHVEVEGLEGEEEAAADHEDVEEDDEGNQVQNDEGLAYQNYEDYGDNEEKVEQYTADSNHGVADGNEDENYNYGTEQVEKYVLRKVYGSEHGYR